MTADDIPEKGSFLPRVQLIPEDRNKLMVVERVLRYTGTREWIEHTMAIGFVQPLHPRQFSNNNSVEELSRREFIVIDKPVPSKGGDQTPT